VTGPLLVLDHHAASRPFGEMYLCDPQAASVGVLVSRLARALGWSPTREAALGMYVSIVSDTGGFRYANTNAEAFHIAADLVAERGVDPWTVTRSMSEQVPLARYRLLAAALGSIVLELDGKVAIMTVTEEMVRQAGAKWEHTEGLVTYARAIEGVECGLLISPARDGGTRLSLRSKGLIDAGAVCAPLGGGGHPGAAGCILDATLADARATVLAALAEALKACSTASSSSTSRPA
jgi:phosphoesterase RecJ-like protein